MNLEAYYNSFFKIEVKWVYNVVLFPAIQQSESAIYAYTYIPSLLHFLPI